MEGWLKVSDLVQVTSIPENTIRRYIKLFPEYFPFKRIDRTQFFPPSSRSLVQEISQLYREGKKTTEIHDTLSHSHDKTLEILPEKDTNPAYPQSLDHFLEKIRELFDQNTRSFRIIARELQQLNSQGADMQSLKQTLEEQQARIQKLEKVGEEMERRLIIQLNEYLADVFYGQKK
ncbi:MAG TPA: hypothetical protein P5560_03105 [Thermotogota bacterium]|nr:hypothetical protein [Thermotogota bacterium]HRW91919.1 hypothetical protein [Thermotogota bacterium]